MIHRTSRRAAGATTGETLCGPLAIQMRAALRILVSAFLTVLVTSATHTTTASAATESEQPAGGESASAPHDIGAQAEEPSLGDADTFRMWQRTAGQQPSNVSVLFNAGLAAARAGSLGHARLYLERARVLAPFDREVRDTLAIVRQAIGRAQLETLRDEEYTEGAPAGIGSWRLSRLVPESLSALGLAAFLWLSACGFVLYSRRRGSRRRRIAIGMMLAGVCLSLVAGTFWGGARWTGERITPAVVVAESPVYQTAPDELGRVRRTAELYEGALVAVEAQSGTWSRIRLADESTVWVRDEAIRSIAPRDGS